MLFGDADLVEDVLQVVCVDENHLGFSWFEVCGSPAGQRARI
jgi:hypothetical protein